MTDLQVVLLALAAFTGALLPHDIPLVVGACGMVVALAARWPVLLIVAVAVLCSSLAHRSWDGINADRDMLVTGSGSVVTDPDRSGRGTTAVVRVDGTRYLATAWGAAGARLARAEAGDALDLEGTARPYQGSLERKAALHVGQRLSIASAAVEPSTQVLWRVANRVRGHVVAGARSLSPERQGLFTGLVYGDDRLQDPVTASDFRLAGLTHLLAVSGQNVAYVLTMARPIIQRFSLKGRWLLTLSLLVVFATVTRFEASVLRATVMAGLAVTGRMLGREASGGRLLALAVTALLIVDPLLANTVAFRLSVAASAGIVWLEPHVRPRRVRPQWLAETIGVTLAAQLAVAPILVSTFGPVSIVSLPANVVAGPLAGFTMAWGLSGGLVAGFLPESGAAGLHQVTRLLLWTLESVAFVAGRLPIAPVGLIWITASLCVLLLRPFWFTTVLTKVAMVLATATLLVALVPTPNPGRHGVGRGNEVWITQGRVVLLLDGGGPIDWLLDDLRALEVQRVDLVVTAKDRSELVSQLGTRLDISASHLLPEGSSRFAFDGRTLTVTVTAEQMEARLSR